MLKIIIFKNKSGHFNFKYRKVQEDSIKILKFILGVFLKTVTSIKIAKYFLTGLYSLIL